MELLAMPVTSVLEVKWADFIKKHKPFTRKQHYNPNFELIAVSEGPLYLQVEQEKMTLHSGDVVFLLPWEQHRGWKPEDNNGSFFWVQFQTSKELESVSEKALAWDWKKQLTEMSVLRTVDEEQEDLLLLPRRTIHVQHKYKLLSTFEQISNEMDEMEGNYLYRSSLLLGSIMEMISTELLQMQRAIHPVSQSYRIFRKTVSFLDNFFMEDLNRSTIETNMDRNYEYLGQLFKKYSGHSIVEYIHQLRMQRSKYLLRHTNKSIKEICGEVGFEDPFYFSKLFKKKKAAHLLNFAAINNA